MTHLSIETLAALESGADRQAAHRMAIAWLMTRIAPHEADAWLTRQRQEIEGADKLVEIHEELGYLQEDVMALMGAASG